jgi:hypothetical protein
MEEIRSDLVLLNLLKEYAHRNDYRPYGLCSIIISMACESIITWKEHNRLKDIIDINRPKFSFYNVITAWGNDNLKLKRDYWWHYLDVWPRRRYVNNLVKKAKNNKLIIQDVDS